MFPPEGGMSRSDRGDTLKGWRAGIDNNNAGASLTADPRRGTLSFVTQKFFCFGAINNRRVVPDWQASINLPVSYIKYSMVPCICYK